MASSVSHLCPSSRRRVHQRPLSHRWLHLRARPWLALALVAATWSCSDPSPLAPDPNLPLRGTYTLTASLSPSCPRRGSWNFRADIEQSGQSLLITLFEGEFDTYLGERFNFFNGQDTPSGVVFFGAGGGTVLFSEKNAGLWAGQALGQLRSGRIDAVFNGRVFFVGTTQGDECIRADHTLTFVRR